jgi:hypothetical protein
MEDRYDSPPVAPWELDGEALVVVCRGTRFLPPLPPGLRRMPGPVLIIAVRWHDSPVGPYIEIAVAVPGRVGLRPGWCVVCMAVTSADARVGGVVNWGFPRLVGSLGWGITPGGGIDVAWLERDLELRARPPGRRALPVLLPLRALQHRSDGLVLIPGGARGWARRTQASVDVPIEDPLLAPLRGEHRAVHVGGLQVTLRPAHHPAGLRATLLAPLQAPEVAASDLGTTAGEAPLRWSPLRAYGSVG